MQCRVLLVIMILVTDLPGVDSGHPVHGSTCPPNQR
jgi:hypothetical protein